ncbi:MAG: sensor histidine kinase [Puniceicoccaceae bacterium]
MESDFSLKHFQRVILALGLITLGIYGAAVIASMIFFRAEIHQQILHRDGSLLTRISQHFHDTQLPRPGGTDWLEIAFESSEISGVIGVRLYQPDGEFLAAIPASLYASTLDETDRAELGEGVPVFRHFPQLSLDSLFSDESSIAHPATYPATEVIVPVVDGDGGTVAIIQYWLDGQELSEELGQMDRFLTALGSVFFFAGGLIFTLVFLYARSRLLGMGSLLAQKNESLRQANANLALAARTSAIGSVTSHLFHGLKNPLAGLKAYLKLSGKDEEAMAIADRMQSLIDEALNVISEDNEAEVELTMDEFQQFADQRLGQIADGQVHLKTSGQGRIEARKAQLALLVVRNLAENAVEASGAEHPVSIRMDMSASSLAVEVEDTGSGLPDHVRERLFEPVQSTKSNGTGIGLAISSVIARHIPATLQLLKSDASGTIFQITVPL